jgi:hypothetical protein
MVMPVLNYGLVRPAKNNNPKVLEDLFRKGIESMVRLNDSVSRTNISSMTWSLLLDVDGLVDEQFILNQDWGFELAMIQLEGTKGGM